MIARNVTLDEVRKAALAIGADLRFDTRQKGNTVQFTLRPENGKWQRRSASMFGNDRKVAAVCWHGHREFFRELFKRVPTAKVQTRATREFPKGERWYTAENFEQVYRATDTNIGSMMAPVRYSQACYCEEGGF